jgi:surface antigen
LALMAALAAFLSGCSMSTQIENLFRKKDGEDAYAKAEVTGSVVRVPLSTGLPPESDLIYARTAITEVLNRNGKDLSAPWENPRSGARGTVTPIASSYAQEGGSCHDFLASHVSNGTEFWMRGEACRGAGKGAKWEVRAMRPWKRT